MLPTKSAYCSELCVALPQPAWDLLRGRFGGGLPCTVLRECAHCRAELDALNRQKTFELEEFKALHAEFQEEATAASASGGRPQVVYCLSTSWFRQWEKFVTNRARDPPGPIDNHSIVVSSKHQMGSPATAGGGGGEQQQQQQPLPQLTLRQNSDYIQVLTALVVPNTLY